MNFFKSRLISYLHATIGIIIFSLLIVREAALPVDLDTFITIVTAIATIILGYYATEGAREIALLKATKLSKQKHFVLDFSSLFSSSVLVIYLSLFSCAINVQQCEMWQLLPILGNCFFAGVSLLYAAAATILPPHKKYTLIYALIYLVYNITSLFALKQKNYYYLLLLIISLHIIIVALWKLKDIIKQSCNTKSE